MILVENEYGGIQISLSGIDKDGVVYTINDYETEENSGLGFRKYDLKDFCLINDKLTLMLENKINTFQIEVEENGGGLSFILIVNRENNDKFSFKMFYYIIDIEVTTEMVLDYSEFVEYYNVVNKNIELLKSELNNLLKGVEDSNEK